jgi:hypothetical protein
LLIGYFAYRVGFIDSLYGNARAATTTAAEAVTTAGKLDED